MEAVLAVFVFSVMIYGLSTGNLKRKTISLVVVVLTTIGTMLWKSGTGGCSETSLVIRYKLIDSVYTD